jgi:hypothetical protein
VHPLAYTLALMAIGKTSCSEVNANEALPTSTFAVNEAIPQAARPSATGDVLYPRVLRRLNFKRFPDSDEANCMPSRG